MFEFKNYLESIKFNTKLLTFVYISFTVFLGLLMLIFEKVYSKAFEQQNSFLNIIVIFFLVLLTNFKLTIYIEIIHNIISEEISLNNILTNDLVVSALLLLLIYSELWITLVFFKFRLENIDKFLKLTNWFFFISLIIISFFIILQFFFSIRYSLRRIFYFFKISLSFYFFIISASILIKFLLAESSVIFNNK